MNKDLLEKGFIPEEICTDLPDGFKDIEEISSSLYKILANNQINNVINEINQEKEISSLSTPQLERAMLLYSYLGHAYMWGKEDVEDIIPKNIAITWYKISEKLDRPPILSYASYALNNWSLLDQSKPLTLDNIRILQNFLAGVDEDWFIMIHVAIEYEAKHILGSLKKYYIDKETEIEHLENALISIKKINEIMNRMPEKCDPYIYYNRVRPYIFGWKNNPATPKGVIYEGVDEYKNEPQLFRGETGAQSSIVPALDALLGVTHSNDPLREYLDEMRIYMPSEHRMLLSELDNFQNEKSNGEIKEQKELINEIINQVHEFRNRHLEYARDYIFDQALKSESNSNIVGTGGTPFMKYLDKHLQETVPKEN